MNTFQRFSMLSASIVALGLGIAASQASAFDEEFAINNAGRQCLNPGDAAENIFLNVFCDPEVLNGLPPAADARERSRTCRDINRGCRRYADNSRRCHNEQIAAERKVLRRSSDFTINEIESERRSCRDNVRFLVGEERGSEIGNCTANFGSGYFVPRGGTFEGNVFILPGENCAPGYNCVGIPGALNTCIGCADLRDICETGSDVEIALLCGNIGFCVNQIPDPDDVTGIFCDFFGPLDPGTGAAIDCVLAGLPNADTTVCERPGLPPPPVE